MVRARFVWALLGCVLLVGAPARAWPAEDSTFAFGRSPDSLRVMTFNTLYATVNRPAPWSERRILMRDLVREVAPDVAGLQEVLEPQLAQIASDLPEYQLIPGKPSGRSRGIEALGRLWPLALVAWIALLVWERVARAHGGAQRPRSRIWKRGGRLLLHATLIVCAILLPLGLAALDWFRGPLSKIGEYAPILYRPDRLKWLEGGTVWLSRTPDRPGSAFPLMPSPRTMHWARFERLADSSQVVVANIHPGHAPWHYAPTVRLLERLFGDRLRGEVEILLGDFNATPSTGLYHMLAAADWQDARMQAERIDGPATTFYWRAGLEFMAPLQLDYVFFRGGLRPVRARALSGERNDVFPSDHNALVIDFAFEGR